MESSLEFTMYVVIKKMQNKLINIVETWIINAWIIWNGWDIMAILLYKYPEALKEFWYPTIQESRKNYIDDI